MNARNVAGQETEQGARARVVLGLRRILCGLNGHDLLPEFEPSRICLRCVSCSYRTPGWILNAPSQQAAARQAPVLVTHAAR